MRELTVRRPQQRTLLFSRLEIWGTLPETNRRDCRDLCAQLLRAVLHAEAPIRSDDAREDSSRSS